MSDNLFLKIIEREIPAEIVYEDEQVLAFNDINPQAPIHVLIIPKKHIRTLNDVQDEDEAMLGRLLNVARKIAREKGIHEEGYRVVMNCNDGADPIFICTGGRSFTWPPG